VTDTSNSFLAPFSERSVTTTFRRSSFVVVFSVLDSFSISERSLYFTLEMVLVLERSLFLKSTLALLRGFHQGRTWTPRNASKVGFFFLYSLKVPP